LGKKKRGAPERNARTGKAAQPQMGLSYKAQFLKENILTLRMESSTVDEMKKKIDAEKKDSYTARVGKAPYGEDLL